MRRSRGPLKRGGPERPRLDGAFELSAGNGFGWRLCCPVVAAANCGSSGACPLRAV